MGSRTVIMPYGNPSHSGVPQASSLSTAFVSDIVLETGIGAVLGIQHDVLRWLQYKLVGKKGLEKEWVILIDRIQLRQ